jgi:AcrR family transcriptional regulator
MAPTGKAGASVETNAPRSAYHHGSLREAMLRAADEILRENGLEALTLRAAARRAGASHAAPKNHFDGLSGLLSELAAIGFERLRDEMRAGVPQGTPPAARRILLGRGYVRFARGNPGMFLLMFRSEKLDMNHPRLRAAAEAAGALLSGSAESEAPPEQANADIVAPMIGAWAKVHGLAMLLLDGRLDSTIASLPEGMNEEDLIAMVIGGGDRVSPGGGG